ncbi:pentatricopeptide repeat-containing protein At2g37320 [Rosa chinensis]|uniref:pentatricopeptide repeat-containing protein At2g37320 n=1 Tax=Rosa chinensis TaxID=74649 RepID=UPI000D08DECB|nr:pentatricopeptide repeat-containing protein At2g37320 [Rosa chinensis]
MEFSFRLGKKLSQSFLHTISGHLKLSPSRNLTQILQKSKNQSNALRVLDLITPKPTSTASRRQGHLRLIQDVLHSDSDQLSNPSSFSGSHSSIQFSNLFDQLFDSSPVDSHSYPESFTIDASVISHAISSCGSKRDLRGGVQHHCAAVRSGFGANVYIGSSLIHLYGKCSALENAYKVFDEMPVRNVVSWTAIISGFAQEWQVDVCLELFSEMRSSGSKPNDFTYASVLSACTGSGALGQGRCAHGQTIRMGFDSYVHIANALMSMYCKCGAVKDALYIFESLDGKDNVSWNSMIAGYAQHGLVLQAIDLFEEMKNRGVKPDAITLLGVLSSCRHAGLVKEGWHYFNSMVEEHGIQPELDHYSCIVDLLGRAGLLDEARDFIEKMPIRPNAVIWGSLLSSCRVHGGVWIGIEAAESRLLMEPGCASTHVQLANLYASLGCWDEAARVRKLMKDKGIKTSPGFSWIEISNEVHRFRAEDSSNPRMIQIIGVLDSLADHMVRLKTSGCELQMQEEEDAP